MFLIATGVFAWRFYSLFTINSAIKKEVSGEESSDNPLSRVFAVARDNKTDTETLELKLAEQILRRQSLISTYGLLG